MALTVVVVKDPNGSRKVQVQITEAFPQPVAIGMSAKDATAFGTRLIAIAAIAAAQDEAEAEAKAHPLVTLDG